VFVRLRFFVGRQSGDNKVESVAYSFLVRGYKTGRLMFDFFLKKKHADFEHDSFAGVRLYRPKK